MQLGRIGKIGSWNGIVIVLALISVLASEAVAGLIGVDEFAYSNGSIGEVSTNVSDGWMRTGVTKSDWNGSAQVVSQKLETDGTYARRAFGDPRSDAAFKGDGSYVWRVVFVYDGSSEVVVSSSDFGTPKIHWGVIDGTGLFGIEVKDTSSSNTGVFTTAVAPVQGQAYVLAGKLDFDADELLLWINPESTSEAMPALTVSYDGDDWSSGVMLRSSADGIGVLWDDLEVGDDFLDLNFPLIVPPFTLPELTISEFMAANSQTVADVDGEYSDWIEILNATGEAVDLGGWYLTDNPANLTKWEFPSFSLAHNGRLLVWASGKNRGLSVVDLHTNFKLSAGGEYLALVKPDGVTVVKDYVWGAGLAVMQQYSDVSYGTVGSAQVEDYFAQPTPGALNVEAPFMPFVGTVLINEVMASASGVAPSCGITDSGLTEGPVFSDWVELYNPGVSALDLSGCRLTDDVDRHAKWRFPVGTTIAAGGYLVVLADGANVSGDYEHTNFNLSSSGGYLGLYDPNGVLLDEFAPEYPVQVVNYSYGHAGYYEVPTPGVANGVALVGVAAAPTFSVVPGFHEVPVTTVVSSVTPGAVVRTELGSALPDETSPTTASFTSVAGEVMVIRARAYVPGMVPSPVVSATYIMNATAAEKSLPAMHFIGDDYTTFWDPVGGGSSLGIIDHYEMRGREWERRINLEMHFADGSPSEMLSAGVRYAGHGDRPEFFRESGVWDYPYARPQFNLFFRGEYGASTWEHDLFSGRTDVMEHDSLRIRLDLGLVDEFIRRLWVDMGNRGSVGMLANLYVNGELRTVVNPVQRIREPLLQEWYDSKNGWDVLAVYEFPDGDGSAYSAMEDYFEDAGNDFGQLAVYEAGGEMLDYTNFADYMLLLSYMGTTDWPGNNKHAARERVSGGKFRFYVWDAQQSMTDGGAPAATEATIDRLLAEDDTTIKILTALKDSEEFRLLWADRIQKHFFNGGALTDSKMDVRWFELSAGMNPMLNEIWSESVDDALYTNWRDSRLGYALSNYKTHGLWFDDLLAPVLSQQGGSVDGSSVVTLLNPTTDPQFTAMSVYYTQDGSDPRLPGGAINPGVQVSTGAGIDFDAGETTILARVYDATTQRWSPCLSAEFKFVGSSIPLVVSEIFYNPPGGDEADEFIELMNISAGSAIDLSGYSFTVGISFTFPAGTVLAPGARLVVARDLGVFTGVYGVPPSGVLYGPFGGALANGGERIVLSTPSGSRVIDFSYGDSLIWPQLSDGDGVALQFVDPGGNGDASVAANWADGCQIGGSPGYAEEMDFVTWKGEVGVVEDFGDSDQDGLVHILEYAFGTNPTGVDEERVVWVSDVGGYLTLAFRKNLAAKDLVYRVEVSDDLLGWGSGALETVYLGSQRSGDGTSLERYRCVLPIGSSPRNFMRVAVETVP